LLFIESCKIFVGCAESLLNQFFATFFFFQSPAPIALFFLGLVFKFASFRFCRQAVEVRVEQLRAARG
jgi:hypothetical protein